jgi:serine/threonine protein kinase/WD40 repeat protein
MALLHTCAKCGAAHTGDAVDGLCPLCVLAVVMEPPGPAVSPRLPPAHASAPGTARFFGNYELLEEIGRGGMGVIYRARQISLNRIVAVKMILAGHFASKESVQRFRAEAETAARLQHPNIVAIHEIGEHEGQNYFSMDCVEGASLDIAGLLPADRAARYLQAIAEAVHYAHERGVLHRDLKPSNVLIDAFDQPRVTDFGLAKQLHLDSGLTVTGQALGSPQFMPPEQASSGRGDVGPRSDVYSLGAVLYHCLTGRPPFAAATVPETLAQVLDREPVAPRDLNPAIPRDLETVCLKCLDKDPQRRYRSALELADELKRFLNQEPIRARSVSSLEKGWRWCRRRPAVASLLAAVVVLLVTIAFGSTTAAIRIKRAETLATEKLRDSYLDQARARRVSGRMGQRFESLAAISNAAAMKPPPELRVQLRNEAIACLALLDARLTRPRPLAPTPRVEFIQFTPKLDRYARLDARGHINVRRAADDAEVASLYWKDKVLQWFHGFSPDNRLLAVEFVQGTLKFCDVSRQEVRFEIKIGVSACDFSPDGQRFVVGLPNGGVAVYDAETGVKEKELPDGFPQGQIRFDATGTKLAWSNSRAGAVEVRNVESGAILRTMPHLSKVVDVTWSSDGRLLAAAGAEGRGAVWDLRTGERLFTLEGHDNAMVRIRFNHSGRLIATTSWDDTTRFWDALTGRPLLRLPGMSYQLIFSADDHTLAFTRQEDRFHLVELALHPEFSILSPSEKSAGPFESAFSPDGRLLANACKPGVQFWDLGTGRAIGLIREPSCRSVRFAADGLSVFTSGLGGLARWPIRLAESNRVVTVQAGAREILPFPKPLMQLAMSADGETLAMASRERSQAQVFTLRNPGQPVSLASHPNVQFVALSPDARWLATGPWGEKEAKVWDARQGARLAKFPAGPNATVEFSLDGQWLVTAGEEYRLWKTGSWEPGPAIVLPRKNVPIGYAAFSPDSRMLAVVHSGRELHLLQVAGARPLAVFETPTQTVLAVPRFSPDGTLLAASGANGEVFVWNLKLIRRELSALQLDWADTP